MKCYLVNLFTTDPALENQLCDCIRQKGWLAVPFSQPDKVLSPIKTCPNIWIIDITVPGYEFIRSIKKSFPHTPVLALAPAKSIADRVIGLEFGSDDYIVKPVFPEEVILRADRLLTRGCSITHRLQSISTDSIVHIEPYKINIKNRTIVFNNADVSLTSKEFELLLFLVSNRGHILTRDQILQYVWQQKRPAAKRAVDDIVYRLRKKLPELPLESYYGSGFKLLR